MTCLKGWHNVGMHVARGKGDRESLKKSNCINGKKQAARGRVSRERKSKSHTELNWSVVIIFSASFLQGRAPTQRQIGNVGHMHDVGGLTSVCAQPAGTQ